MNETHYQRRSRQRREHRGSSVRLGKELLEMNGNVVIRTGKPLTLATQWGRTTRRLTAASAPGFSRPLRGVRLPRSRRRKKPAGLPRRNRLVVSNSKNRDPGTGVSKFNGGGMFGCRDSTSSACVPLNQQSARALLECPHEHCLSPRRYTTVA